jgi:hypothetical protein
LFTEIDFFGFFFMIFVYRKCEPRGSSHLPLASHEIVTRLRLVPARTFSDSCLSITSSLKADA